VSEKKEKKATCLDYFFIICYNKKHKFDNSKSKLETNTTFKLNSIKLKGVYPIMAKNILVVDGSSLLSSCYYGTIPKKLLAADKLTEEEKEMLYKALLHAPDGTYTNAIYAFLKILSKIITEFDYERICFCFDKGREKLSRKKLYPAYKAQRKETPPPLKQQYITIENLLSDLGFTVLYSDEDEADKMRLIIGLRR